MRFSELARTYERMSRAKNDPERVRLLAAAARRADAPTLEALAHFTLGEMTDPREAGELGVGPGLIRDALAEAAGVDASEVEEEAKRAGDMGEVAGRLARGRDRLTVVDVWRLANKTVRTGGERAALVREVFGGTTGDGAKYFTRMALNQMRTGAGLGTLARALASAFDVDAPAVEHLYAMTNDIGLAAASARRGPKALARAGLSLFHPYQFMNAQKVESASEIFSRLAGKDVIFEVKYDGARLQIHVRAGSKKEVRLYSRRLNDDTAALPDVVAALACAWRGGDAILEGEAVAYDPTLKKKQAFQAVLQRLGRKHGVAEKAREIPLVLHLFDMLYHDGEDLMGVAQSERRARLAALFREGERVKMTDSVVTSKQPEAEKFFRRAVRAGHEGLMAKDPDAHYTPGRRTEDWMKLKPAFETLDVVVVGGIWGSGRRRGLLSSLVVAVVDRDAFKTVGKVGTGFSEQLLRELTARLEPKIITTRGHDVEIEPEVVIEVDFQDIQKTERYEAGYVLRIPRFKRLRTDKSVREADTLARLKRLYAQTH
ncbi:MAG TPA: ATP-dependent DNA ligase [Pyrinomonadaceae bacterium]|nr:ATP-dependent DNA ligase [Pyrinomonadaceae bacterium]